MSPLARVSSLQKVTRLHYCHHRGALPPPTSGSPDGPRPVHLHFGLAASPRSTPRHRPLPGLARYTTTRVPSPVRGARRSTPRTTRGRRSPSGSRCMAPPRAAHHDLGLPRRARGALPLQNRADPTGLVRTPRHRHRCIPAQHTTTSTPAGPRGVHHDPGAVAQPASLRLRAPHSTHDLGADVPPSGHEAQGPA